MERALPIILSFMLIQCSRCSGSMGDIEPDAAVDAPGGSASQGEYIGTQVLRGRLAPSKGPNSYTVNGVSISREDLQGVKGIGQSSIARAWLGKSIELKGDVYDYTCEPGMQCKTSGHIVYMMNIEYIKEVDIMVASTCTDAPMDDGGEVTLIAFEFDKWPINACEYDRCVDSGKCTGERVQPPRKLRFCTRRAVGMSWENAQAYCETRGMDVQNQYHDYCIRSTLGDDYTLEDVIEGDGSKIVTAGFRCVRATQDGASGSLAGSILGTWTFTWLHGGNQPSEVDLKYEGHPARSPRERRAHLDTRRARQVQVCTSECNK